MPDPLSKVLLGDEAFVQEMEKLIRVIRHGGAGSYKGKSQFTYPELKEIANDGDFFDYFEIGDIITPSRETGVNVVASSNGLTVTISEETFLAWVTANVQEVAKRDYELTYDGSEWLLHEEPIVLSNLGVTCTGTPAKDDKLIIHENADVIYWRLAHNKSGHPVWVTVFPVLTGAQFCASQKLHIFSSGLPAGTYKFTLDHGSYGGDTGADGSYVFTSTQAIPSGGWLRLDGWGYWKSTYSQAQFLNDAKVKTYDASGNVLETLTPFAYSSQELTDDLGKYSARKTYYTSAELDYKNGMEQQGAGYNEYIGSAIDQWANSKGTANNWFQPNRVFDMKPNFANIAGFMHGLDDEFIQACRFADVVTKGETVWNNRAEQTIKRKFYLLSNKEVGFTSYADEGEYLDWYKQFGDASNSARADRVVRTTGGSAQYWWTRTAYCDAACIECGVGTDGSYGYHDARYTYAFVLACEF